jgi:hypothetical protein
LVRHHLLAFSRTAGAQRRSKSGAPAWLLETTCHAPVVDTNTKC